MKSLTQFLLAQPARIAVQGVLCTDDARRELLQKTAQILFDSSYSRASPEVLFKSGSFGAIVALGWPLVAGGRSYSITVAMSYGMYISAAGAHAQSQRLEVLSNNLANVDTVGFKREMAVLESRHSQAIELGDDYAGSRSVNDVGGGVHFAEAVTDFSRGSLKKTDQPTDLAIDGEGFFVVDRNGESFLTRAGNFHFSTEGQLLSQQGHPVVSNGGQPIRIDPALPWRWLENGAIEQAGTVAQIGLVRPGSLGDLAKSGENLFHSLGPVSPVENDQRRVLSGFLEHSSVKPATEMMELIETSRVYEANVRMIQNHDQMMGALVTRVMRQS